MAAMCLAAGLAVGYLLRAPQSRWPSAQVSATASLPSSRANSTGAGHTPTLEDMKQMADKQAAPLLEKLKSDPNNSSLLIQVGAIYHTSHQFKQASSYYEKAAQIEPRNVSLRNKLASSMYRSGDADGAIAQLNKALSDEPKDANSLFNLGMIKLQGKADGKGALAAWQQLLKSNPQMSADRRAEVQKLMADVLTTMGNQHRTEGATKR
jgi:cytochrome c-type biogenesis protein CcmH/NrfG